MKRGADRPVLLVGTDGLRDDRFDRTWDKLQGPVRRVELDQANHWVFTDYATFAPQLHQAGLVSDEGRASLVGTDPCSVQLVRSLVLEFFNRNL